MPAGRPAPRTASSPSSPTRSRRRPARRQPHIDLRLLPGRVRPTTQAAVGADTVAALSELRVDVAFLGTNGLTVGHGLTTPDPDEAAIKRAIVGCGRLVVALVDASKFGVETAVRFAAPADVDVVVTDDGISAADRRALTEAGIEVSRMVA